MARGTTGTTLKLAVSPRGDDARARGPLATLERALELTREARSVRGAPRNVVITLAAGTYPLTRGLLVERSMVGPRFTTLTIRAEPGATARLLGGVRLTDFEPVTDKRVRSRLRPAARSRVLEADLTAHGVKSFGTFRSRGFSRKAEAAHLELFYRGRPMTVARWPNDEFLTIAGFPERSAVDDEHQGSIGSLEGGFTYEGDRPASWASTAGVWVHGYWAWDWANSYEEVDSLDPSRRLVKTKPPHGSYGFRKGNRFYFLNVLEELDTPGEYYVDAERGMLYFWPPGAMKGAEVIASIVEEPLLTLEDVQGVTVEGICIEAGRGRGIVIRGGRDNAIRGCAVRNLGTAGIVVEGGEGHQILDCDVTGTGDGGISLTGGDRKSLSPSRQIARNNHIYAIGRWSRTYCPAIEATGVGMHISHNLIHDLPHIGIIYWGNEMLIEYNHIHHATLETGDAGAIYTGRDFTARGTVIRYNYIHDMGGVGMGTMGVYLDDCVSGETVYGNVFVRVQRAAMLGGGRDITVENNVFVECAPAIQVDARGTDPSPVWRNMIYAIMRDRLRAMHHHRPPYSVRYPELKDLDRYYARDEGIPPEGNVVARNVCVAGAWMDSRWHARAEGYVTFVDNVLTDERHFIDAPAGDYRIRKSSPLFALGFHPIPFREIGLERSAFRHTLESRATAPLRPRGGSPAR